EKKESGDCSPHFKVVNLALQLRGGEAVGQAAEQEFEAADDRDDHEANADERKRIKDLIEHHALPV
ncbi:MAG TPA: hypothetical protein VHR66_01335, partial [Gemmataceae bacterium]|nr:hypothetical protein [Gemmataceae bacterium]